MQHLEVTLLVQPLGCSIRATVVHHNDLRNGAIATQAIDVLLE
jgi:hypothetical protein